MQQAALFRRPEILALVLAVAFTGGCGGGGNDDTASEPPPVVDPKSGLDQRPVSLECTAPPKPGTSAAAALVRVFPNLSFDKPLAMLQAPGNNDRWYVVEKDGRVWSFENQPDVRTKSLFLDLTDRVDASFNESGLFSIAFHPDFQRNGEAFVSYTRSGAPLTSHVSRFSSIDGGATLDRFSEEEILVVDQPTEHHQGGHIAFGPDGFLYFGLGDGGGGGRSLGNGQDVTTLLGSVLRIDVDVESGYAIPPENPFADGADGRPEIFAWGFRNPWRWSFDRLSGDLWLGDVGLHTWEEVNVVEIGGNYGWEIVEGTDCLNATECDQEAFIEPVAAYSHDDGVAITGGYVYRGGDIPGLYGSYVYGDYGSGNIWALDASRRNASPRLILQSGVNISSFAESAGGELFLTDLGGRLFRISPQESDDDRKFPVLLSDTGCVDPDAPTTYAEGVTPYQINVPFWSDGAEKSRWLTVPPDGVIHETLQGDWEFPVGSVLIKDFRLSGKLIETRLLVRHDDGTWGGYSYEWNEDQTEAYFLRNGKTKVIDGQEWIYPSSAQCIQCHTQASGYVLGPETAQMNLAMAYPSTGRTANQLYTYSAVGLIDSDFLAEPESYPSMPSTSDPKASLEDRARAYLHTNCSQCHRPDGPTQATMDLRFDTPLAETGTCDAVPEFGDLGVDGGRLIVPGQPEASIVYLRASSRASHGMPPLGSTLVDHDGMELLASWIESMAACP